MSYFVHWPVSCGIRSSSDWGWGKAILQTHLSCLLFVEYPDVAECHIQ